MNDDKPRSSFIPPKGEVKEQEEKTQDDSFLMKSILAVQHDLANIKDEFAKAITQIRNEMFQNLEAAMRGHNHKIYTSPGEVLYNEETQKKINAAKDMQTYERIKADLEKEAKKKETKTEGE